MFKTTKQRYAFNFFAVFAFIVMCSSVTAVAQSITGEASLPYGCDFNLYAVTGETYFNTEVAVNTTTNRIYAPTGCETLLEFNANDNSSRIINLGITAQHIAVDSQRNLVYMAVGGNIMVFNANTNAIQTFAPPPEAEGFGILGEIAVNSVTNHVYFATQIGNLVRFDANNNSWAVFDYPYAGNIYGLAIDSSRNKLYAACFVSILTVDLNNNSATYVTVPSVFHGGGIAVNPATNRIYATARNGDTGIAGIMVLNGDDNTHSIINLENPGYDSYWYYQDAPIVVNPNTNRVYSVFIDYGGKLHLITMNGDTSAYTVKANMSEPGFDVEAGMAINPVTNRLYIPALVENSHDYYDSGRIVTVAPDQSGIITTGSTQVQADVATLNFSNVTSPGTVSVTPISDPATAGDIPGGFAVSNLSAFEVTPDANLHFTGSVTSCFQLSSGNSEADFNNLVVLHRELNPATGQYQLFDRTSSHNYSTHTICASTTSFSPFYVAKIGNKIRSLFDRSKAFRAGSTVPVKLQLLNAGNQNISSSSIQLTTRGLRRIGTNTTSTVTDSGNSNPDFNFRYDSSLQGYIYNLKTTGLSAGKYVLSFYAGADRAFFYTVEFEVR